LDGRYGQGGNGVHWQVLVSCSVFKRLEPEKGKAIFLRKGPLRFVLWTANSRLDHQTVYCELGTIRYVEVDKIYGVLKVFRIDVHSSIICVL